MDEKQPERYGRQLGEACAVETLVFNQHELRSRSQGLDKWPTKGRRQASLSCIIDMMIVVSVLCYICSTEHLVVTGVWEGKGLRLSRIG
jgi:hypothetical protein